MSTPNVNTQCPCCRVHPNQLFCREVVHPILTVSLILCHS
ncbi:unnamed protein product [Chondrus crispus]|uniref:Uncharacterized protein n=1 Tax=Chondrus crispus TaxID=2769 RepID=R7QPU4_CHOCR|nr:unnamed protein product [Chondrus crispus]CDF40134.1 unnamed protein product [Chondrus crispus]|eukprot:XP_005710428.1 unnamed protein product [Chondrus crispus]